MVSLRSAPTSTAARGASMSNLELMWTKVDEAPALATYSLLPIVEAFVGAAGVSMKLKDISYAVFCLKKKNRADDQRCADAHRSGHEIHAGIQHAHDVAVVRANPVARC